MSESVVSAKRGWGQFGAKPAQSETPVRAAAKRSPSAVSGDVSSVGLLPRNEHDVAEAVVAKLGHRSEILRENCTLPGLQGLHKVIHGFFGFEVDFF